MMRWRITMTVRKMMRRRWYGCDADEEADEPEAEAAEARMWQKRHKVPPRPSSPPDESSQLVGR